MVLVGALLVWVVARARAMVAGRPPLGYIDIPSSVSTRSSLSSGAAGDIGDLSETDTEQDTPDLLGNLFFH